MSEIGSDSDGSEGSSEYQPSLDVYRLRWRIHDGPLWENIHVLDDPGDPDSAQKPFQDENGILHEVASRRLSDDEDLIKFIVPYPWLNGDVEDEEALPRLSFKLPAGQPFFTIGDYVLRVHPWLVKHRDDMLQGLLANQRKHKSWPASTQLWFDPRQPKFDGDYLLNSATGDIDATWVYVACEAQDMRYNQKRDSRQQARLFGKEEEDEPEASLAFHRLRWEAREGGSMQQCVRVAEDVMDVDSEQLPFQDAASGTFHDIADLPATVEPTARLILYFPTLEGTGPPFSRRSDHDGTYDLTPRPDNIASEWSPELTLVASDERDFISIKDYVLGAYDWVLSLRSRFMEATRERVTREGPEEAWFDPTNVYAVNLYNTKEHFMREQWQIVGFSAQDLQGTREELFRTEVRL